MHTWHQRVELTADLQHAQHLVNELEQVLGIGETAEHVGNDLEFSKLLGRILPQTPAEEIPYTVITELLGLLLPLVRAAVLDGHRDRSRLVAGPRTLFTRCLIVFGRRVVVQYGLPGARADLPPAV